MLRLLLDPTPDGGGGAATPPNPAFLAPPAASAPPPPPPALVPAAPASHEKVTLSAEEFRRLLAKENQANAAEAEQVRLRYEKQQAEIAAATEAGNHKKALDLAAQQHQEKLNAVEAARVTAEAKAAQQEREILGSKVETQVSASFAGRAFVSPEAQAQAQQILSGQVEAVRGPDNAVVLREKATGRPAAEFLKEALDSRAFAHFQAAGSAGGAGSQGGDKPGAFVDGSGKFDPRFLSALTGRFTGTQVSGTGQPGQAGGHIGL
jgi:hypothetical protein